MIKATGSQIIVKLLELEGIKTVAGMPGGQILPLYDELNRSSIKHVLIRQEQGGGFIAQGMTRSTGKTAVCLATSGPGAMNLLTAIADARSDSVPIIAITGQVNRKMIGTDSFQEADTFGLSFPISKHSIMVKSALELLTAIPEAFAIANAGRPGPVLIDVPRDVQLEEVEFDRWPSGKDLMPKLNYGERYLSKEDEIKKTLPEMAKALLLSKKCVFYLGGGCNSQEVSQGLKSILDDYNPVVVTSLMGIGAYPKSKANNFGMLGMHGHYAANVAMHDADTVVALGVRFDDRATGVVSKFCPNAKIIHIDVDAAEINKIIASSMSLITDLAQSLPLLKKELDSQKKAIDKSELSSAWEARNAWFAELDKIRIENHSFEVGRTARVPEGSVNPRQFISEIPSQAAKVGLKENDIIVTTDVGQHQMWSAQYYPVEHARQFLTSGSLGTMGFGLPAAIGASLANRDKRVVCISGDGSIMMNVQELATLAEQDLDVTVIVFKNGTLGMVRQQQEYLFKENYSASIFEKQPDLMKIAEGFGIPAVRANDDADWASKAFAKGPHFVEVDISMGENVLPFVKGGCANIDALMN